MPGKDTFSVRLDPAKRKQLDSLATQMERPRSYLIGQAIDHYLAYHEWKQTRVEEGQAAAERGEFVSHDDLFRELRSRFPRSKSR